MKVSIWPLILASTVFFGAELRAEPTAPQQRVVEIGRERYGKYCASCHGLHGKGDGVLADVLKTAPSDLTTIAARRHGKFPDDEIKAFIDGRKDVKGHGNPDMPVWGDRLSVEAPGKGSTKDAYVENRIALIVAFLKSIQSP